MKYPRLQSLFNEAYIQTLTMASITLDMNNDCIRLNFLAYGMIKPRHIDAVYIPEDPQNTPFASSSVPYKGNNYFVTCRF